MTTFSIRHLTDDAEVEAFARVLSICFSPSLEEAHGWIKRGKRGNARLLTRGDHVAGGLFLIPMAQWYGGCSVPMVGIGGVGVDPGDRADGGATFLMHRVVEELHEEGVALSTLYPATQPLYRRAGYEQAGAHFAIRLNTQRIFHSEREPLLRRAAEEDLPEIERLHRAHGRENPGNVDRSELYWSWVREGVKRPVHAFVVEGEDALEGYVYYTSQPNDDNHQDLWVRDVVARTPRAARRLLTFFRDHRSLVDKVRWRGSPADPLLLQAREQRHDIRLWDIWMLRIVHLVHALEERGYPMGLTTVVHLEVNDDLCPNNAGRWVMRVSDGSATVEPGGQGRVHLGIRALAALYTGFASATQLRTGLDLKAPEEDAAALDAVFGGPSPWMQDGF